jgi:glycerol kinase
LNEDIAELWQAERCFTPRMPQAHADELYSGWRDAIERLRTPRPLAN